MEGDPVGGEMDEWTTVDKKAKKKSRQEVHPAKPANNPSEGWQGGRDRKQSRAADSNNPHSRPGSERRQDRNKNASDKNYGGGGKPPSRGGSSNRGTLPRKYSQQAHGGGNSNYSGGGKSGPPPNRPPSVSNSVSPNRSNKPAVNRVSPVVGHTTPPAVQAAAPTMANIVGSSAASSGSRSSSSSTSSKADQSASEWRPRRENNQVWGKPISVNSSRDSSCSKPGPEPAMNDVGSKVENLSNKEPSVEPLDNRSTSELLVNRVETSGISGDIGKDDNENIVAKSSPVPKSDEAMDTSEATPAAEKPTELTNHCGTDETDTKPTTDNNSLDVEINSESASVSCNLNQDNSNATQAVISNDGVPDSNGNCLADPNDNSQSAVEEDQPRIDDTDANETDDAAAFMQYDRDFLLQLQRNPLSLQKPEKLPDLEIVLNTAMRPSQSAPLLGEHPNEYVHTLSRHPPPSKRDSRRKEPPRKVISISREPVKLRSAENAWMPTTKTKENNETEMDALCKKVRSILNKLTPQKFDKLVKQFQELAIDNEEKLVSCTELVFEKALDEPVFSVAYAKMCRELLSKRVPKSSNPEEIVDFRSMLLRMCQKEFEKESISDEKREQYEEELKKAETEDDKKRIKDDFEQLESKLRKRSLGNIRFIGELYKLELLGPRLMHTIIKKLIKRTDDESLESLCNLLTTIGQLLEKASKRQAVQMPEVGTWFDTYFGEMADFVANKENSSRIRFLMQDVIDLRKNNWVSRRKQAGPKTIDEIHKEAKIEALKIQMADQEHMPPTPRRSEDRRRSRPEGPRGAPAPEDWNNVPSRPAKMQEKIDPMRLMKPKTSIDPSLMKFGPPGGVRNAASWGRGSIGGGSARKPSAPASLGSPVVNKNRFELFDDDMDSDMASSPPSAAATTNNHHQSQNRSLSPSRETLEDEESKPAPPSGNKENTNKTISVDTPSLKGDPADLDVDKWKNYLEEFLVNCDYSETYLSVCETFHASNVKVLVESSLSHVVERTARDQRKVGDLLAHLVKQNCLGLDDLVAGYGDILGYASELLIDIPKFWDCMAATLVPVIGATDFLAEFIERSCKLLDDPSLKKDYCLAVFAACKAGNSSSFVTKMEKARDRLETLLETDLSKFVTQTYGNYVAMPNGDSNVNQLSAKLKNIFTGGLDINEEMSRVDKEFRGEETLDKNALKVLTTAVIECSLEVGDSICNISLNPRLLKFRVPVLKKYLDANKDRQMIALYAVQSLVHRLQHPNKLLQKILEELHDQEVVSEDAILEWEKVEDPEEKEGRAVALESCSAFLNYLKEEDEEPEGCEKVKFEL